MHFPRQTGQGWFFPEAFWWWTDSNQTRSGHDLQHEEGMPIMVLWTVVWQPLCNLPLGGGIVLPRWRQALMANETVLGVKKSQYHSIMWA